MKFDFRTLYNFWFGTKALDDQAHIDERMKLWFGKNPQIDAQMRTQFAPWLDAFPSRAFDEWEGSDKGLVTMVVLLDQVPRNAYRGTAQSFAYDSDAVVLTHEAVENGLCERVHPLESMFLLLPLEHSEKLSDQQLSVKLFDQLAARAPSGLATAVKSGADYARRHLAIIERFGRFPHRNQILGRPSSAEEVEFLKQGEGAHSF